MMKVFLDTNIVIDLLDKRESFYIDAIKLFTLAYQKEITLFVSPMTYATASYLLRKHGKEGMKRLLSNFRQLSQITTADEKVVDAALESSFNDYEDALQYYSALTRNVDIIVTRNKKDFTSACIPVLSPEELLAKL